MKRAIVVQGDGRFASVLLDRASALELRKGMRVRAREALDVRPYRPIRAGEMATVCWSDPETGHVELMLDENHDDLRDWRNCLILEPFSTDEWIEGLELASVYEAKETPALLEQSCGV